MIKKSLKRRTDYRPKKLDDDWYSIGASIGEKIDIEEVMDVQDRTITFGRKKTPWEKITDDLQDKASNTSQYVKLVNAYLKGKKSHIEKIIELTNNFDQEIQNLKSDNNKITKLSDTPIHEFNSMELKGLAQDLLKDRETRKNNLKNLKNEIIEAEKALHQSDIKIEKLNDQILDKKLEEKRSRGKHDLQNSQMIKDLSSLIEKYDPKTLSETLRKLSR